MSKRSVHQPVCVDSTDFLKPSIPTGQKKGSKSVSSTNTNLSGSCGDLNQQGLKTSPSFLSRDDSISSKNSSKSLFSNIMQSFDNSSGFSISQGFVPRVEKTLTLFDIIITTLKEVKLKYSAYEHSSDGPEGSDRREMCCKVENRILLIRSLRSEYETLIETKKDEVKKIESTIKSAMSNKNDKQEVDMLDCETYWEVCREMCIVESKLERCAGKLQFQIMELDSVSRVNAFDQYDLSIRLNDASTKFKTRIKIERNGHQIWDNTTFVLNPTVDDTLDVKFVELKTLNKSLTLLERKVPLVNNLILSEPSIYTFWLTPIGTIKLKVIVQWNACIDDPDLMTSLAQIDNKFHEFITKDGVTIRKRQPSNMGRFSHNRLSVNFGSLFRSEGFDKTSPRGSMENIAENIDDNGIQPVSIRKGSYDKPKNRTKHIDDPVLRDFQAGRTIDGSITVNITAPSVAATQNKDEHDDDPIVRTIVESSLTEPNCDVFPDPTISESSPVNISIEYIKDTLEKSDNNLILVEDTNFGVISAESKIEISQDDIQRDNVSGDGSDLGKIHECAVKDHVNIAQSGEDVVGGDTNGSGVNINCEVVSEVCVDARGLHSEMNEVIHGRSANTALIQIGHEESAVINVDGDDARGMGEDGLSGRESSDIIVGQSKKGESDESALGGEVVMRQGIAETSLSGVMVDDNHGSIVGDADVSAGTMCEHPKCSDTEDIVTTVSESCHMSAENRAQSSHPLTTDVSECPVISDESCHSIDATVDPRQCDDAKTEDQSITVDQHHSGQQSTEDQHRSDDEQRLDNLSSVDRRQCDDAKTLDQWSAVDSPQCDHARIDDQSQHRPGTADGP